MKYGIWSKYRVTAICYREVMEAERLVSTGKNRAANKHATSGYLTAYTYFLTRNRNLLRYA